MESAESLTLGKNIWELQRLVRSGKATARARQMLLRAYAQQVETFEEGLGLDADERSFFLEAEGARDGVLFVHGTQSRPGDLRALAEAVRDGGLNAYGLRLPAGPDPRSGQTLQSAWESALIEVQNRYEQFSDCCKNVAVVGAGFGSALALQLDVRPRPAALVLLSPALFPRVGWFQRLLLNWGLDRIGWIRRRLGPKAELLEATGAARRTKWWYKVPAFAAMCADDAVYDVRALGFLRARLSHHRSEIHEYPSGGHEFFMGESPQAQQLRKEVAAFLVKNAAQTTPPRG